MIQYFAVKGAWDDLGSHCVLSISIRTETSLGRNTIWDNVYTPHTHTTGLEKGPRITEFKRALMERNFPDGVYIQP